MADIQVVTETITQNPVEEIYVIWDWTRFTLVQQSLFLSTQTSLRQKVIILNPKEALKLADFIYQQLGQTK